MLYFYTCFLHEYYLLNSKKSKLLNFYTNCDYKSKTIKDCIIKEQKNCMPVLIIYCMTCTEKLKKKIVLDIH